MLAADPEVVEGLHDARQHAHQGAAASSDAIAAYQRALALDPEHEGAAFSLALAYKQAGQPTKREPGFERVLQLNPRSAKALCQLADIAMRRGDFAEAEAHAARRRWRSTVDRAAVPLKLGEAASS